MAYFWHGPWRQTEKRKKEAQEEVGGRLQVRLSPATDVSMAVALSLLQQVMASKSLLIFSTVILDGLAGLSGGLLSEHWLIRHQVALTGFAAGASRCRFSGHSA